jgi:rod shape-determining protein MreC
MENIITRYRNASFLVAVLFVQMLMLGVQVKRTDENRSTRLIRVWAVDAITPFEKLIVGIQHGVANLWHEYFYLRGVRQENRDLKQQIERMQLEEVRLKNDADQARRLQKLLGFKEQVISKVLAAQVIGSSGSERSRVIYIDKGTHDGIEKDMPVITAEGVVGKVLHVFNSTSEVLLIDDQTSGVGTILEQSRLQGVLKGTPGGEVILDKVMNGEQVQSGERVLTSGGDEIFPKGLLVGTVAKAVHGPESFLAISIKPAADLGRLEEVLVITRKEEREPEVADTNSRAVDILAERLPSVPDKKPDEKVSDNKVQPYANDVTVIIHAPLPSATVPGAPKTSVVGGVVSGVPTPATHKAAGVGTDGEAATKPASVPKPAVVTNKQATPEAPKPETKTAPAANPDVPTAQPNPQTAPATPPDQPQ